MIKTIESKGVCTGCQANFNFLADNCLLWLESINVGPFLILVSFVEMLKMCMNEMWLGAQARIAEVVSVYVSIKTRCVHYDVCSNRVGKLCAPPNALKYWRKCFFPIFFGSVRSSSHIHASLLVHDNPVLRFHSFQRNNVTALQQ